MKYVNYIKINTNDLLDNISYIKNNYKYDHYIYNVSNNAFNLGMYIINYFDNKDILYTSFFNDVLLIRKFNKDFKIIYSGEINSDNVYDLVVNNVIFLIKSVNDFKELIQYKIKDKINVILNIDLNGLNGISSTTEIHDILNELNKYKHVEIIGVKSSIIEKEYSLFLDIIKPLKDLEYIILNNENDKNKIKLSNSIILDNSIFGININKKDNIKPIYSVVTKVTKIVEKKRKRIAIVPIMMNDRKVLVNNNWYKVIETHKEYSLIEIDNSINQNDEVIVYNSANYNLPIVYDDYILEKIFVY